MLLWFAGMGVVVVWTVFRSPLVDYRLVVAGSLLPLVDAALGGPRVLHSVTGSVVLLAGAMALRPGRRLEQRRLVALPIGTFLHLLLDGTWTDPRAFWWPFSGWGWPPGDVAEANPAGLAVVLEAAGAAALWWAYRRFGLADRRRRERFLRTGQLAPVGAGR